MNLNSESFRRTDGIGHGRWLHVAMFVIIWFFGTQSPAPIRAQSMEQVMGVESSVAYPLLTGAEWSVRDATIQRVVHHLSGLPQTQYHDVAVHARTWKSENSLGPPHDLQHRAVSVSGRLLSIERIAHPSAGNISDVTSAQAAAEMAAAWSEETRPSYYCRIRAATGDEQDLPIGILCGQLPQGIADLVPQDRATRSFDKLSIRVGAVGLALDAKRLIQSDGRADLLAGVVLADRLAWYPADENEVVNMVSGGHLDASLAVELAARGFDVGRFSSLKATQRRPLLPEDSEVFYRLLTIAEDIPNQDDAPGVGLPIQRSIVDPAELIGRRFRFPMVVKQVTRVPLAAGERGPQLGLQQYYLLHGLIPLDQPLRLRFSEEQRVTFDSHYPVVVAIPSLPAGWAVGDKMRQWATVDAIFLKSWSYESARSRQEGVPQWSPLLVGCGVQPSAPPDTGGANWPIGWLLMIPVGLAIVGVLTGGLSGWTQPGRSRPRK